MRNSQVPTCIFLEINLEPWHHTRRPKAPPRVGLCAIAGCSQTLFQLEGGGAHHCRRCGIVVHNTSAQERSWFVEDDLGVATSLLQ
jgi:hypothetical protein